MTKEQIEFLKLLDKYELLTPPQIYEKMNLEKIYKDTKAKKNYYEVVCDYIEYPCNNEEFDDMIEVRHYNGDEVLSNRSEFSINESGKEFLKKRTNEKKNNFINIVTIIGMLVAIISLIVSIMK